MRIFIVADTHYLHDSMVTLCRRPKDFEERTHRNLMKLTEDDTLFHLGDISLGHEQEVWKKYIRPLRCRRKILVRGNHDKKSDNWFINRGWDFVVRSFTGKYFGKKILFSHIPQPEGIYDLNIHGHLHNSSHHDEEPEIQARKHDKQRLLSLEEEGYKATSLYEFLKREGQIE